MAFSRQLTKSDFIGSTIHVELDQDEQDFIMRQLEEHLVMTPLTVWTRFALYEA